MKCEKVRELYSSYWENTIEPPLRVAFEQHLAQCGQCSAEYDRFHATVMMLEELPEVESPPDFHAAVMARLEQVRRATPKRVRWWDLDWQKVFTIQVPARGAALGFAVLLMMVLLIKLTPINAIVANIIGLQRASDKTPDVQNQNAPLGPKPWSLNREVRYARGEAGLYISVTPASATDKSSVYVLWFGTEGKEPIPLAVTQFGDPGKPRSGEVMADQPYSCPITVAPSNGSRRSETARVTWRHEGREYTEYVFVPSDYDSTASETTASLSLKNATIYGALSRISAEYGVVILASGDVEQASAAVDTSCGPQAAIQAALSQTGLQARRLSPSIYAVEPTP